MVIILYYAFFLRINVDPFYSNDLKRNISLYRDLIEKSISSKEAVGYLTEAVYPSGQSDPDFKSLSDRQLPLFQLVNSSAALVYNQLSLLFIFFFIYYICKLCLNSVLPERSPYRIPMRTSSCASRAFNFNEKWSLVCHSLSICRVGPEKRYTHCSSYQGAGDT